LATVVGPKRYNRAKRDAYECGIDPTPQPIGGGHFSVKYYLTAMLFIIFDIETVFLYPWAVTFASRGYSDKIFFFAEMIVFVVILFIGYFYILGKGALDWDESERAGRGDVVTPEMRRQRPAIRFGNENSGDVSTMPAAGRTPSYGASSQEERILTTTGDQ